MKAPALDDAPRRDGIRGHLVSQFGNPRGILGSLVGYAMAVKNRRRVAWAVEQLEPRPHEHILEIGFGPGVSMQLLLRRVPDCRITGVDLRLAWRSGRAPCPLCPMPTPRSIAP